METLRQTLLSGLKKATEELEEFRLQANLGKSEAHDLYEEAKEKYHHFIHEAKLRLEEAKKIAKEKSTNLTSMFEALQVQLTLGKAETKDLFEDQIKKISKALNEIETLIIKNKTTDQYFAKIQIDIEKFKIKLDILKLRFNLNMHGARDEFEEKKKDFSKTLSDIKKRFLEKEEEAEQKWKHIKDEISNAYSSIKKEFVR